MSSPLDLVDLRGVGLLLLFGLCLRGTRTTAQSTSSPTSTRPDTTFSNPIIEGRDVPGPWVVRHNGWYYLTGTMAPNEGIVVWKSRHLVDWSAAVKDTVWMAPEEGPMSSQLWAPELYRFDGQWYLYVTASDGEDAQHRHYVLESAGDDPMGKYRSKGRMDKGLDEYAIDESILQSDDGSLYWMYAAQHQIGMAPMENPWTANGAQRTVIAEPSEPWERGWIEAPETLRHDGRQFIVYSAGHSATPHYVLGRLTHTGGELLGLSNWRKPSYPRLYAPRKR